MTKAEREILDETIGALMLQFVTWKLVRSYGASRWQAYGYTAVASIAFNAVRRPRRAW